MRNCNWPDSSSCTMSCLNRTLGNTPFLLVSCDRIQLHWSSSKMICGCLGNFTSDTSAFFPPPPPWISCVTEVRGFGFRPSGKLKNCSGRPWGLEAFLFSCLLVQSISLQYQFALKSCKVVCFFYYINASKLPKQLNQVIQSIFVLVLVMGFPSKRIRPLIALVLFGNWPPPCLESCLIPWME